MFRVAVFLCGMFSAGVAHAACDKRFDGLWANETIANGQCAVATFGNDSAKGQTGAGTWTTIDESCEWQTPAKILEAEYDNKIHGNMSAKMIDADTCEITFGKAHVLVDRFGAWKPVSRRARLDVIGRDLIELCFDQQGHQFGQCVYFDYIKVWK